MSAPVLLAVIAVILFALLVGVMEIGPDLDECHGAVVAACAGVE